MKKASKYLIVTLLVLLVATTLVACSTSEDTGAEVEEQEVAEETEKKVFRAGTPAQHYPWNYMEDGELKGIDIDILNEVGRRIGYEVEFETVEFSGIFGLIDNGKVDTGACQITKTPDRVENYTFSDEYAYTFYKLAVREDDDSITTVDDLVGKTFIG